MIAIVNEMLRPINAVREDAIGILVDLLGDPTVEGPLLMT
jgi:hypothetical protein